MKKSFVARLLVVAALAALTTPLVASAQDDERVVKRFTGKGEVSAALRASSPAESTFIGYNSAYAGQNYWSIGPGDYRPFAAGDNGGYWSMDIPVNGDSLMGWWTIRQIHSRHVANTVNYNRPNYATDFGNQLNFVQPQGKGRTFGVIGAWHRDIGGLIAGTVPGANPIAPAWTSPGSGFAAWCGLRGPGDLTAVDPITGNAYNSDAAQFQYFWGRGVGAAGKMRGRLPGYIGGWDQMLYRDVAVPGGATSMDLEFRYQSAMSTDVFTGLSGQENVRTGWFHLDPISAAVFPDPSGNFVSAERPGGPPRDSFMVYVGQPVEPVAGADNDFVASDGNLYEIYDVQRRWFSEVIKVDQPFYFLFGAAGNNAATTVTANVAGAQLTALGSTVRFVFRVKTGRGFDDFYNGSVPGGYNSGYAGAVQIDDVKVTFDVGGVVLNEDFESAGDIDNATGVSALSAFKSTGKPAATYAHLANVDPAAGELLWEDECGLPNTAAANSNMRELVFSMGNREGSQSMSGAKGTTEQEFNIAIVSPTINLVEVVGGTNNMGLTEAMLDVQEGYQIQHDIYTGGIVNGDYGAFVRPKVAIYPATQADGQRGWSEWIGDDFIYTYGIALAQKETWALNPLIGISSPNGVPLDSIRFGLEKSSYCQRFAIPDALCGLAKGLYFDNLTLLLTDPAGVVEPPPFDIPIWAFMQDAFPANTSILPGTAAFDTTAAHVKPATNQAPNTATINTRFCVPGDTSWVDAGLGSDAKRVDLVFRISPGPGNYVTLGDRSSGLRVVPTSPTAVTSGDGSFWAAYLDNNGEKGTPGGHPAGANFAARWDPLTWNSARMDTVEGGLFPIQVRNIGNTPTGQYYATSYHELDPKYAALGIPRNKCFLIDPVSPSPTDFTNITCGRPNEPAPPGVAGAYPPDWVTIDPGPVGYDGNTQTVENTKILRDGLFTPGTHIQYFYRNENLVTGNVGLGPDTSTVSPQASEGPNTDGHRWQQWSVLPDMWKKPAYGGLGIAPLLVIDNNDRRGDERVWVSVADSIGATSAVKRGAHNGWSGPSSVSVNNPAYFVSRNQQPGTTWDLYNNKASESSDAPLGFGSRSAYSDDLNPSNFLANRGAKVGPTVPMLEAYYSMIFLFSGDLTSEILGPYNNHSSDEQGLLTSFLLGTPVGSKRGLWMAGEGLVTSLDPEADGDPFLNNLGVRLEAEWYTTISGNANTCPDVVTFPAINTNGDIYGVLNTCTVKNDVLATLNGGLPAAKYEDAGGPDIYLSSVYRPDNATERWVSLVDGWDILSLRSRFCATSHGRLAYFYNAFANLFGTVAIVNGTPAITLDAPNTGNGRQFVDFMNLRNNPVVKGSAAINFGLSKSDRVTIRVYDVTGREIRNLLDGQMFKAGEHTVLWDGVDNSGRLVPRGVYFAKYSRDNGSTVNTKVTILK